MQQHQRLTRAVDLVIHLETIDIDIAGLCSAFFHSDAFQITGVVVGSLGRRFQTIGCSSQPVRGRSPSAG